VEEALKNAQRNLAADNLARMQESLEELSKASRTLSEVILYDPKAMGGGENKPS
jgi:hypothetical protein